jgi:RND family efflux transporter MFP subunit
MNGIIARTGLSIAIGWLLAGCSGTSGEHQTAPALPPVRGAQLETVKTGAIPELVTAVGTVRAVTSAAVAARIPGVVATLTVKEGDRVQQGQLLLTLQAQETTAGAAGAMAAVEEAQRGLDEARSRQRLAESTFGRYEKLLAEQAVTRQEFDQRQSEREVASQGVARAEARLTQVREAATSARTVAGYSRVTAPIAGVVTRKQVDLGATVFPGMPLVTIEAAGNYLLELAAPESLLGKIKVGERAGVAIDGLTTQQTGTVAEVVPLVDPATRTFTVKVTVAGAGLRSGQYGRGSFTVGSGSGISLPTAAVREKGALAAVWTVDQAQTARLRLVKAGRTLGERVEIVSGLSDGDRVIVGGAWPTAEGARVE